MGPGSLYFALIESGVDGIRFRKRVATHLRGIDLGPRAKVMNHGTQILQLRPDSHFAEHEFDGCQVHAAWPT